MTERPRERENLIQVYEEITSNKSNIGLFYIFVSVNTFAKKRERKQNYVIGRFILYWPNTFHKGLIYSVIYLFHVFSH